MISITVGVLSLLLGLIIVWNSLKGTRRRRSRGRVDSHIFQSMELDITPAPSTSEWVPPIAPAQKKDALLQFDFGPKEEKEPLPTGLTAMEPLGSTQSSPLKTPLPPNKMGLTDEDDEEPRQGTLGF